MYQRQADKAGSSHRPAGGPPAPVPPKPAVPGKSGGTTAAKGQAAAKVPAASKIPPAREGSVEVRPVRELNPQ